MSFVRFDRLLNREHPTKKLLSFILNPIPNSIACTPCGNGSLLSLMQTQKTRDLPLRWCCYKRVSIAVFVAVDLLQVHLQCIYNGESMTLTTKRRRRGIERPIDQLRNCAAVERAIVFPRIFLSSRRRPRRTANLRPAPSRAVVGRLQDEYRSGRR